MADGFDFAASEHDADFKFLVNVILIPGFAVFDARFTRSGFDLVLRHGLVLQR